MDLTVAGREKRIPDILDAIAALSSDAVPTPPELARAMLDLLPADVWTNPDFKWLDPTVKSGSILREIAARLMVGLEDWQPDPHKRAKHIMTNMLHGLSITKLHAEMGRRSVYRSKDAASDKAIGRGEFFDDHEGNIRFIHAEHKFKTDRRGQPVGACQICGAPTGLERGVDRENYAYSFIHDQSTFEELKGMKFDVIVGNPPYQVSTEGHGSTASPIYQDFIDAAISLDPKYVSMIVPSRWFAGGKGLGEFRDRMIADRRLSKIVDNPKLYDCFPGVKIQGGVNYFLWDRGHAGDCEFSTRIDGVVQSTLARDLREGDGVLVRDNRAVRIIERVKRAGYASAEEKCTVTKPFGLTMRSNYPGSVETPFEGAIPLLYSTHVGYSRHDQIQRNHQWIDTWKVLLPMAFGDTGESFTVTGEPIALAPGSACVQTYFIVGMFESRTETENYARYLATKFARFLIAQRKVTQHVTPDRFRFVPMLDFTRRWTDEDLYAHFELGQDEIDYVEASIKPRSVNLSLDSPIPASHLPGGNKYRPPGKRSVESDDEDED